MINTKQSLLPAAQLSVLDLLALASVGVGFVLCCGRLLTHISSRDDAHKRSLFHNSITASLSFVIISQILGVIFALTQLKTERQLGVNVTPDDVETVTKVYGSLKVMFEMFAGIAFGITTLNRFQPFADGFGLYKHTTAILMVILVVLAVISAIGAFFTVLAYRSVVVTLTSALFWVFTVFFDLIVMIFMLYVTVAKKKTIVQIDQSPETLSTGGRGNQSIFILRRFCSLAPTLRRSNRTLIMLLIVIVALDLLALFCFLCELVYRQLYLAISMFSSNALVAFYLVVAIEYLSQFRNVLRIEAKKNRIGTNTSGANDGTGQPTTQFNSFEEPYVEDAEAGGTTGAGAIGADPRSTSEVDVSSESNSGAIQSQQVRPGFVRYGPTGLAENADNSSVLPQPEALQGEEEGRLLAQPIMFAASTPFAATRQEEVDIRIGDKVRCFRTFETGWGYGENVNSGRSGMFPLDSVSVVEKQLSPVDQLNDDGDAALAPLYETGQIVVNDTKTNHKEPVSSSPRIYTAPLFPVQPTSYNITLASSDQESELIPKFVESRDPPINRTSGTPIRMFDTAPATVIKSYEPSRSDEIRLQIGDHLAVAVEYDDGFAFGANLSDGNSRGIFPLFCCEWDSPQGNS
ncbi:hypothetical protein BJ742DRAFT_531569 [Cladochytrium replicatum]|nr:hypothetical protein BJ742DRAFT_531569 [Cladochytrium replicatum]